MVNRDSHRHPHRTIFAAIAAAGLGFAAAVTATSGAIFSGLSSHATLRGAHAQSLTFLPSVNLNNQNALAFAQSALVGDERVLFGGVTRIPNETKIKTDDPSSYYCLNASRSSVGINANPTANADIEWGPYSFALPIPMSGAFATQYDNILYVTPMGTHMDWGTGCDDCVWYAHLDQQGAGSSGAITWIPIPFDKRFAPRRKAGMSASPTKLRFFGGVPYNSTEAIREVLTYCLISKMWYVEAKFSSDCPEAAGLASCVVFYISDAEYKIACVSQNMWSVMVATWLPASNDTLTDANILPLDRPLVGGMMVTQVGQYLVGFSQRIGRSGTFGGGCSPYVLVVDMTTGAIAPLAADDVSCRFGGTVFSNGPALHIAGGIDPETMALTGVVEYAEFGPYLSYVTRSGARDYTVGDNITILTQPCGPGTVLRLANSPTCQSPIKGTVDTACVPNNANDYTTGSVTFPLTDPAESAYLCVAFGSCQVPQANRTACPFATPTSDFYTCTHSGCCYDSSYDYYGNDRCFAYIPIEMVEKVNKGAKQNDHYSNRTSIINYFMLVPPTVPFTIRAADSASDEGFFASRSGIIIMSCVGAGAALLISIILIGVLRLKMRRVGTDSDAGDIESQTTRDDASEAGEYYGKYKILKKLGQGGFGSVFLVERITDRKLLALKHIVCKDEEERNYAVTEFEILYAAQGHENMINLEEMIITWEHNSGKESTTGESLQGSSGTGTPIRSFTEKKSSGGSGSNSKTKSKKGELAPLLLQVAPKAVCIVMDYCPDGDLSAYVNRVHQLTGKSLPEHLLLRVVADQVCSLLIHLQSRNPPICHRDLKPENILLKDNATKVLVTDFGLAQSLEKSYMSTRAGTLHYMAPECWKRHYTATVDMWALGCILYACATVRVNPEQRRVMFHDAKRPNFRQEIAFDLRDYSELFRTIVLGLLIVDPVKRFTAEKVLELLSEN